MEKRGVETHLVHLAPLFNPFALWRLTRLLMRERVTLLQTHGARANFYGRIAGYLAGVPVIISTVHNSLKDYEVRPLRRGLYVFLLRLTLPIVHRIICVSDANSRDLLEECPAAAAKMARAAAWLEAAKPVTNQDRAFQLLGLAWAGRSGPELRAKSQKSMTDGNFKDAYEGFKKLCLDTKNEPGQVGNDLNQAVQCLQNLGRWNEVDALIEGLTANRELLA
jgi:hypothetical protein